VEALLVSEVGEDPEALIRHAVRANIWASTKQLRCESEILGALIREDGLLIVGAEYSLDSGVVEFFDDVPKVR
jgi:carbonic anhydrase